MDDTPEMKVELSVEELAQLSLMVRDAEVRLGNKVDPKELMNLYTQLENAEQGRDTRNSPSAIQDTILNALRDLEPKNRDIQEFVQEHRGRVRDNDPLYRNAKAGSTHTSIYGVFDKPQTDTEEVLDGLLMDLDRKFGQNRVGQSGFTSTIENPFTKTEYTFVAHHYSLRIPGEGMNIDRSN